MKFEKVIRKRIRRQDKGVNIAGDIQAAVAANIGEKGSSRTRVSSRERIVQRSGRRRSEETRREPDRGIDRAEGGDQDA